MVWVKVLRAALKQGSMSGAPMHEKTVEVPVSVEVTSANMTPRVDGGHVNEVEPRPEDAHDGAALILGCLRGPGFNPP
jgi:hypothetical protein